MQCVMARTLYSYARVLPAYAVYRACRDSAASSSYSLSYALHSSAAAADAAAAAAGAAPSPQRRMERFAFAPIETMTGSFRISVKYQANLAGGVQRSTRAVSIPQHVITDYIRPHGAYFVHLSDPFWRLRPVLGVRP